MPHNPLAGGAMALFIVLLTLTGSFWAVGAAYDDVDGQTDAQATADKFKGIFDVTFNASGPIVLLVTGVAISAFAVWMFKEIPSLSLSGGGWR